MARTRQLPPPPLHTKSCSTFFFFRCASPLKPRPQDLHCHPRQQPDIFWSARDPFKAASPGNTNTNPGYYLPGGPHKGLLYLPSFIVSGDCLPPLDPTRSPLLDFALPRTLAYISGHLHSICQPGFLSFLAIPFFHIQSPWRIYHLTSFRFIPRHGLHSLLSRHHGHPSSR